MCCEGIAVHDTYHVHISQISLQTFSEKRSTKHEVGHVCVRALYACAHVVCACVLYNIRPLSYVQEMLSYSRVKMC